MNRIEKIESYLVTHMDKLDFIIDDVLFWLPDSYFYTPEINQGELLETRNQLNELFRKKKFPSYASDKSLDYQYKKLVKKYNISLKQLALRKREELKQELYQEADEMKVACLIGLVNQYKLLSRLRTYQ